MANWKSLKLKGQVNSLLQQRQNTICAVRKYFLKEGFLEVETPVLQKFPNLDQNVHPIKNELNLWLHTSPELSMKKLLCAGSPDIFQISKVFRKEEVSPCHRQEFTMLEWYELNKTYEKSMERCTELISFVHRELFDTTIKKAETNNFDLIKGWNKISMEEAFNKFAGISLGDLENTEKAVSFLKGKNIPVSEAEKNFEGIFFRFYVEFVEPALKGPVILYDYPASMANLAKIKFDDPRYCERFELFFDGIELANGYTELTDYYEQRKRFYELSKITGYPVDEDFLEALKEGMPECTGVALGMDRLIMIMYGCKDINEVVFDL